MSAQRLYPIQPFCANRMYPARYYPGVLPDGSQVLMKGGKNVYGLWFTPDGWLREVRIRFYGPYRLEDPREVREKVAAEAIFAWQEEIGFRPGLIRVRQFSISRPVSVYISDYPSYMYDYLDDVDEFSYEELDPSWPIWENKQSVDAWRAQGNFVLCWDYTSYILDGEGNPAG